MLQVRLSSMNYPKQKPQTVRLLELTKRLYASEKLRVSDIASEYNLSARTLRRDMQKIREIIPLHNERGVWSLDILTLKTQSSDLNHTLLQSFAHNIDIEFSSLDKSNIDATRISFAINYAKLPKVLGEQILHAIVEQMQCSFQYTKPTGNSKRVVDPMQLYTQNESWYLIARDYKDNRIKTFLLPKVEKFVQLETPTTYSEAMEREAEKIVSNIWHSSNAKESLVRLYIKPHIAHYIERKQLHTTQEIVDRHHDGGLEIECIITNKMEILPAIKSWLPHIYILEPKYMRDMLLYDIESYQQEHNYMDI